jgi:hypothetical protein
VYLRQHTFWHYRGERERERRCTQCSLSFRTSGAASDKNGRQLGLATTAFRAVCLARWWFHTSRSVAITSHEQAILQRHHGEHGPRTPPQCPPTMTGHKLVRLYSPMKFWNRYSSCGGGGASQCRSIRGNMWWWWWRRYMNGG